MEFHPWAHRNGCLAIAERYERLASGSYKAAMTDGLIVFSIT
jgi:hypothetical protein